MKGEKMKRISIIALLVTVLCSTACAARGKQPLAFTALPQAVQDSVLLYYTADQVQFSTGEKTMPKHFEYELRIDDGTKMQYNQRAVLEKISNKAGVKEAFIPAGIMQYVRETFPNAVITEFKRSPMKQEVELNNDLELVFNKRGQFLRIED